MSLITLILFIVGFFVLIIGAEVLVRGASRLAIAAGISPLVVGLTVVAYGTSAPELAVTVQSSYAGQSAIAIGNVVGSNIANVLLILGISAAFKPLMVSRKLVRWDIPVMIALSILMLLMSLDGQIGRLDGLILFTGAVTYTIVTIWQSRKNHRRQARQAGAGGGKKGRLKAGPQLILIQLGLIIGGLSLLVLGSRWLVKGAVALAQFMGASELVIGLTIVAIGTSLPEIATSIAASIRGERDIAVGNAVGSNIFNILLVLGLCAIVAPAGVDVAQPALYFDIPVMVAVMVACLPIFFTGYAIARWEGFLFLGYYAAYTLYLFLNATRHEALAAFSTIMVTFVLPITGVTLVILTVRAIRINNRAGTKLEVRETAKHET